MLLMHSGLALLPMMHLILATFQQHAMHEAQHRHVPEGLEHHQPRLGSRAQWRPEAGLLHVPASPARPSAECSPAALGPVHSSLLRALPLRQPSLVTPTLATVRCATPPLVAHNELDTVP